MILPLENVLFHGSSIQNVERILESDRLLATGRLVSDLVAGLSPKLLERFPDCRVASLSRNLSAARAHSSGIGRIQAAVLMLDADKIKQRIGARLIACNDIYLQSGTSRHLVNESEEAAIGGLRPIRSLVMHVILFKIGQRSISEHLADLPRIAAHPGLVVITDRRRAEWDNEPNRTFERFIGLGPLRKKLSAPLIRHHREFRAGPKRLELLKKIAASEGYGWKRKHLEPNGAPISKAGGSLKWRPAV
jgi:hypothetical protein